MFSRNCNFSVKKLLAYFLTLFVKFSSKNEELQVQQLFRDKFGPDYPSLMEISSRAAYTIVNSEPLLDYATPTLNRMVYVGGLGAREPKRVDKVSNFFENNKNNKENL